MSNPLVSLVVVLILSSCTFPSVASIVYIDCTSPVVDLDKPLDEVRVSGTSNAQCDLEVSNSRFGELTIVESVASQVVIRNSSCYGARCVQFSEVVSTSGSITIDGLKRLAVDVPESDAFFLSFQKDVSMLSRLVVRNCVFRIRASAVSSGATFQFAKFQAAVRSVDVVSFQDCVADVDLSLSSRPASGANLRVADFAGATTDIRLIEFSGLHIDGVISRRSAADMSICHFRSTMKNVHSVIVRDSYIHFENTQGLELPGESKWMCILIHISDGENITEIAITNNTFVPVMVGAATASDSRHKKDFRLITWAQGVKKLRAVRILHNNITCIQSGGGGNIFYLMHSLNPSNEEIGDLLVQDLHLNVTSISENFRVEIYGFKEDSFMKSSVSSVTLNRISCTAHCSAADSMMLVLISLPTQVTFDIGRLSVNNTVVRIDGASQVQSNVEIIGVNTLNAPPATTRVVDGLFLDNVTVYAKLRSNRTSLVIGLFFYVTVHNVHRIHASNVHLHVDPSSRALAMYLSIVRFKGNASDVDSIVVEDSSVNGVIQESSQPTISTVGFADGEAKRIDSIRVSRVRYNLTLISANNIFSPNVVSTHGFSDSKYGVTVEDVSLDVYAAPADQSKRGGSIRLNVIQFDERVLDLGMIKVARTHLRGYLSLNMETTTQVSIIHAKHGISPDDIAGAVAPPATADSEYKSPSIIIEDCSLRVQVETRESLKPPKEFSAIAFPCLGKVSNIQELVMTNVVVAVDTVATSSPPSSSSSGIMQTIFVRLASLDFGLENVKGRMVFKGCSIVANIHMLLRKVGAVGLSVMNSLLASVEGGLRFSNCTVSANVREFASEQMNAQAAMIIFVNHIARDVPFIQLEQCTVKARSGPGLDAALPPTTHAVSTFSAMLLLSDRFVRVGRLSIVDGNVACGVDAQTSSPIIWYSMAHASDTTHSGAYNVADHTIGKVEILRVKSLVEATSANVNFLFGTWDCSALYSNIANFTIDHAVAEVQNTRKPYELLAGFVTRIEKGCQANITGSYTISNSIVIAANTQESDQASIGTSLVVHYDDAQHASPFINAPNKVENCEVTATNIVTQSGPTIIAIAFITSLPRDQREAVFRENKMSVSGTIGPTVSARLLVLQLLRYSRSLSVVVANNLISFSKGTTCRARKCALLLFGGGASFGGTISLIENTVAVDSSVLAASTRDAAAGEAVVSAVAAASDSLRRGNASFVFERNTLPANGSSIYQTLEDSAEPDFTKTDLQMSTWLFHCNDWPYALQSQFQAAHGPQSPPSSQQQQPQQQKAKNITFVPCVVSRTATQSTVTASRSREVTRSRNVTESATLEASRSRTAQATVSESIHVLPPPPLPDFSRGESALAASAVLSGVAGMPAEAAVAAQLSVAVALMDGCPDNRRALDKKSVYLYEPLRFPMTLIPGFRIGASDAPGAYVLGALMSYLFALLLALAGALVMGYRTLHNVRKAEPRSAKWKKAGVLSAAPVGTFGVRFLAVTSPYWGACGGILMVADELHLRAAGALVLIFSVAVAGACALCVFWVVQEQVGRPLVVKSTVYWKKAPTPFQRNVREFLLSDVGRWFLVGRHTWQMPRPRRQGHKNLDTQVTEPSVLLILGSVLNKVWGPRVRHSGIDRSWRFVGSSFYVVGTVFVAFGVSQWKGAALQRPELCDALRGSLFVTSVASLVASAALRPYMVPVKILLNLVVSAWAVVVTLVALPGVLTTDGSRADAKLVLGVVSSIITLLPSVPVGLNKVLQRVAGHCSVVSVDAHRRHLKFLLDRISIVALDPDVLRERRRREERRRTRNSNNNNNSSSSDSDDDSGGEGGNHNGSNRFARSGTDEEADELSQELLQRSPIRRPEVRPQQVPPSAAAVASSSEPRQDRHQSSRPTAIATIAPSALQPGVPRQPRHHVASGAAAMRPSASGERSSRRRTEERSTTPRHGESRSKSHREVERTQNIVAEDAPRSRSVRIHDHRSLLPRSPAQPSSRSKSRGRQ